MTDFDPLEFQRQINSVPNPHFSAHEAGQATITIIQVPKYQGSSEPENIFYHYNIDYGEEPPHSWGSSDNSGIETVVQLTQAILSAVKAKEPFQGRPSFVVRYFRMEPVEVEFTSELYQRRLDELL